VSAVDPGGCKGLGTSGSLPDSLEKQASLGVSLVPEFTGIEKCQSLAPQNGRATNAFGDEQGHGSGCDEEVSSLAASLTPAAMARAWLAPAARVFSVGRSELDERTAEPYFSPKLQGSPVIVDLNRGRRSPAYGRT
jgi:hypothetical protein